MRDAVSDNLVSPLEAFYNKPYPSAQRMEICKRFASMRDEQLVAMYDKAVEAYERLPMLSKLVDLTKAPASEVAGGVSDGEGMPWVVRQKESRRKAKEYALWFMQHEAMAKDAVAQGWAHALSLFVEGWGYVQCEIMAGADRFGVQPDMLCHPKDAKTHTERLDEMKLCNDEAKKTGVICVKVPLWFVRYAQASAERLKNAPAFHPMARTMRGAVEAAR